MDNTPDFIGKVRVSSVPPNENHDIPFYYGEERTRDGWRSDESPSRDRYTALLVLLMEQGMTVHPTDSEEELDRMMAFLNAERYQQFVRNVAARQRYGPLANDPYTPWQPLPQQPLPELGEDVVTVGRARALMDALLPSHVLAGFGTNGAKLSGYGIDQLRTAMAEARIQKDLDFTARLSRLRGK